MATNNDRRHHVVIINGKEYSRDSYLSGYTYYSVRCSNGILRTLKTSSVIARIDAACMESDHVEALAMDAESNRRRALIAARTAQNEFSNLTPAAMRHAIENAHLLALSMNTQYDFNSTPGWQSQLLAKAHREALEINAAKDKGAEVLAAAHAEALIMDARYDAGLSQQAFGMRDKDSQDTEIAYAHSEALLVNDKFIIPTVKIVIGDLFSVSSTSVVEAISAFLEWRTSEANAGRGGSIHWPCDCFASVRGMKLGISPNGRLWREIGVEFTDYEGWKPHVLQEHSGRPESGDRRGTHSRTPVQIIADYVVRFLNNNKGAMLTEAKGRLEKKIAQFASDGCNEQEIRQAFAVALSCRSGAAFREACEAKI